MSFVKVESKAIRALIEPGVRTVKPNMTYSLVSGGFAARLLKKAHSSVGSLTSTECHHLGLKVRLNKLSKNCIYFSAMVPLDLSASYQLQVQGLRLLEGYLTAESSEDNDVHLPCIYQFHPDEWLTDDDLNWLIAD
ncbi:hypothetical protein [Photobacterium galatheae]|uniref:Uncharacterized protein n=1 Tax=Photobacterium galatheae TaxID=1654360 RepID=A0A066RLT7_9GAMM|nr:hypothetical protein [Photobacterium galatheae]KDM90086.1 hypothetical protein EA58_19320 [Photobacterium galatheae]MCM0150066.1 hypothetical protein [Photobacterium galatheae]